MFPGPSDFKLNIIIFVLFFYSIVDAVPGGNASVSGGNNEGIVPDAVLVTNGQVYSSVQTSATRSSSYVCKLNVGRE